MPASVINVLYSLYYLLVTVISVLQVRKLRHRENKFALCATELIRGRTGNPFSLVF